MEELVKCAERLHNRINNVCSDLVLARATDDFTTEVKIMLRMEKLMEEMIPFLKHIIDRKHNVVDLGDVWHRVDKEPMPVEKLLHDDKIMFWDVRAWDGMLPWSQHVKLYGLTKWAYLKDLLPKGDD